MKKNINLTQRNGVFYFRARLPGGRELKRSLKTRRFSEAKKRAEALKSVLHGIRAVTDIEQILKQLADAGLSSDNLPAKKIGRMQIGDVEINDLEVDPSLPGDAEAAATAIRAAVESKKTDSQSPQTSKPSPLLGEAIEAYITDKQRSDNWTNKTAKEIRGNLELLQQIICVDVSCGQISYETSRTVKDKLFKLPPNIVQSAKYKGLSIDEIIALGEPPRSISTANKLLNRYSSLFEWMMRHGYVDQNYFSGLTVQERKKDKKSKRRVFTAEELDLFFTKLREERGQIQNWRWFVPYLLLYTGARLEEMCQLWCSDVYQKKGRWVISVNDNGDETNPKTIKTPASERLIPVHPALLKSGFIDFVRAKDKDGHVRIFHELKWISERYGHYPSREFGRIRASLGWKNMKPKLDTHSLRHTVATQLEQSGVPEYILAAILGHEYGISEATKTYTHRADPDVTGPYLDLLKFDIPLI